jgi:hypothetical protein
MVALLPELLISKSAAKLSILKIVENIRERSSAPEPVATTPGGFQPIRSETGPVQTPPQQIPHPLIYTQIIHRLGP